MAPKLGTKKGGVSKAKAKAELALHDDVDVLQDAVAQPSKARKESEEETEARTSLGQPQSQDLGVNAAMADAFDDLGQQYREMNKAYTGAAYNKVAAALRGLNVGLTPSNYKAQLKAVSGVGKVSLGLVAEYLSSGALRSAEELQAVYDATHDDAARKAAKKAKQQAAH